MSGVLKWWPMDQMRSANQFVFGPQNAKYY